MKIAAALTPIDPVHLLAVDDREADRPAFFVEHAGVHREGDIGCPLAEPRLDLGERPEWRLTPRRGDEFDLSPASVAHRESIAFERLFSASGLG
jgi:hypothetical protein